MATPPMLPGARSTIFNGLMQNDMDANFNKIWNLDTSNLGISSPNAQPQIPHFWIDSYDNAALSFHVSRPATTDLGDWPSTAGIPAGNLLAVGGAGVYQWVAPPAPGSGTGDVTHSGVPVAGQTAQWTTGTPTTGWYILGTYSLKGGSMEYIGPTIGLGAPAYFFSNSGDTYFRLALGYSSASATSGNYTLAGNGTNTYLQAPGGSGAIYMVTGGATTSMVIGGNQITCQVPITGTAGNPQGTVPENGVVGQVLTQTGANPYQYGWAAPASPAPQQGAWTQSGVSSPQTSSTSYVMAGINCVINCQNTGRVLVTATGTGSNTVAEGRWETQLAYGTGAAPVAGQGQAGTLFATAASGQSWGANQTDNFCLTGLFGFSVKVPTWIDFAIKMVNLGQGGVARFYNLYINAFELDY